MIFTKSHTLEQIIDDLTTLGTKRVAIIGCAQCATTAGTGGKKQVEELASNLSDNGFTVVDQFVSETACKADGVSVELTDHLICEDEVDAVMMLACGAGVQTVADAIPRIPVIGGLESVYLGSTVEIGSVAYDRCRMCGACSLGPNAGICALTSCPKGLLNGPCGGMWEGKCEVYPERACVHVLIRQRLLNQGRPLPGIITAKDHSATTGPGSIDGRLARSSARKPASMKPDEDEGGE